MKHLLFILLLLSSILVFGQNKKHHKNTDKNVDSVEWYNYGAEVESQIGLESNQNTKNKWLFRLRTENQVIDVWKNKQDKLFGKITSWVKEYIPYDDEKPTNRVYYEFKLLDSVKVHQLVSLIDSTRIKNVPDGGSIKNWKTGYDGIYYKIERSNTKDYSLKTYWEPSIQYHLKEAIIVQKFIDRWLEITDAKQIWSDFTKKIPYEFYINYGPWITSRKLTKKERRKLKKERRKYRRKMKKMQKNKK